jgi:hypothetical protein
VHYGGLHYLRQLELGSSGKPHRPDVLEEIERGAYAGR